MWLVVDRRWAARCSTVFAVLVLIQDDQVRRRRSWTTTLAVLLGLAGLVVGCSESDGPSALPPTLPDNFEAVYSEDGGMLPWSRTTTVTRGAARHEIDIFGDLFRFDFTPEDARVAGLYDELVEGKFDLYEVIPWEEGDEIFDAEGQSWRITAGDVSHRLGTSGEEIDGPDTDRTPLSALRLFADVGSVPTLTESVSIVRDPSVDELVSVGTYEIEVIVDLRGGDAGFDGDLFDEPLLISWAGGPRQVEVSTSWIDDAEVPSSGGHVLDFVDGAVFVVRATVDGGIEVVAG